MSSFLKRNILEVDSGDGSYSNGWRKRSCGIMMGRVFFW